MDMDVKFHFNDNPVNTSGLILHVFFLFFVARRRSLVNWEDQLAAVIIIALHVGHHEVQADSNGSVTIANDQLSRRRKP